MIGLEFSNFYNDGFGWICRPCEKELSAGTETPAGRMMREGEAESKHPVFSNSAMAKWTNASRTILTCPRCGTTEHGINNR